MFTRLVASRAANLADYGNGIAYTASFWEGLMMWSGFQPDGPTWTSSPVV